MQGLTWKGFIKFGYSTQTIINKQKPAFSKAIVDIFNMPRVILSSVVHKRLSNFLPVVSYKVGHAASLNDCIYWLWILNKMSFCNFSQCHIAEQKLTITT